MTARAEWLRAAAREAARERLAQARAAVRKASAHKRTAIPRARETCRAARASTREWVRRAREELRAEIARMRAELAQAIEHKRAAVRQCCGPDRARARADADKRIAAAREALAELRRGRQLEAIWRRSTPAKQPRGRARARELEQESDHDVTSDLTPDELIVWRSVGRRIKAGPRRSRLEAFRHWLHDHSGEVARLLEEDAQRAYEAAIAREEEERARLRDFNRDLKKRTPDELRRFVRAELEAVPF